MGTITHSKVSSQSCKFFYQMISKELSPAQYLKSNRRYIKVLNTIGYLAWDSLERSNLVVERVVYMMFNNRYLAAFDFEIEFVVLP